MKSLLKKLTFSFLTALIVFVSVAPNLLTAKAAKTAAAPTASAAPTWYNSSFKDWYGKVYDPNNPSEIFGERYTAAQVQWVIYGLWSFMINTATGPKYTPVVQCFLSGAIDVSTCADSIKKLLAEDQEKQRLAGPVVPQKQESNVWKLVFSTNRPFSGISYVSDRVQNFSLVPVAHAQVVGFGFNALNPIQGMWSAFRDLAFGIFVIVAIVFAFMIMFRVKLSPQTVISVQSALPKIVTALILVTFSYAIAGFLIDFMYVVIGLISYVADAVFKASVGFGIGPTPYFNFLTMGQPLGTWATIIPGVANAQFGILGLTIMYFIVFFVPLIIILSIVGAPLALLNPILWFAFVILIAIIAIIIAIWTGIKISWALLKAFANIILLTIFAPLQIAFGTIIPSFGFGQWVRSFASNLAVFVVTGTLFLFSFLFIIMGVSIGLQTLGKDVVNYILQSTFLGSISPQITSAVSNSVANTAWPPLLGTGSGLWVGLLFLGVSFILYTLTPKANEIIQGLLSGKPFAYGTAIGEAFGGVGMAYQYSGARDKVEMARKAAQQVGLSNYLQDFDNRTDALARAIKKLESSPIIGQRIADTRANITAGVKPHG